MPTKNRDIAFDEHVEVNANKLISGSKFFKAVEKGEITPDQWCEWARKRYAATFSFIPLLEKCLGAAESLGDSELTRVIKDNLLDEKGGRQQNGDVSADFLHAPHMEWRRAFFGSLGVQVDCDDFVSQHATDVRWYGARMGLLFEDSRSLVPLGALLFNEKSIPIEFGALRESIYGAFPSEFLEDPADEEVGRTRKRENRLYLDHHIGHDQTHYSELRGALIPHIKEAEDRQCLIYGIDAVCRAKKELYAGILRKSNK